MDELSTDYFGLALIFVISLQIKECLQKYYFISFMFRVRSSRAKYFVIVQIELN